MNTLRELGEFVGISQGSLQVHRFGGPPVITLKNVSILVMNGKRTVPMRALIQALQNLTAITLETEIVGSRSGEEPFIPIVRLNASGGITWFTSIDISLGGKVIASDDILSTSGGDFTLSNNQLGPGEYQLVATRSGISNVGFVSLNNPLGTISVSAPPPPPPPPPPDPVPPTILVQQSAKGDGSFVISGKGFLGDTVVTILVGDGSLTTQPAVFTVTTIIDGSFSGFQTGNICTSLAKRFFEASDGRIKPSDHSQLFSNTVEISCPA